MQDGTGSGRNSKDGLTFRKNIRANILCRQLGPVRKSIGYLKLNAERFLISALSEITLKHNIAIKVNLYCSIKSTFKNVTKNK